MTEILKKENNTMMIEELTEQNILSLLVGRSIMLPWRCQSDLNIIVPYEEYSKFLMHMVNGGICYLDGDIDVYHKALQKGNELLLHRLYLRDLSASIYNEVSISYNYGKDATLISTGYQTGFEEITLADMLVRLREIGKEKINEATAKLSKQMFASVINVNELSEWNLTLYYYSVYLRALTTSIPRKEKIIV